MPLFSEVIEVNGASSPRMGGGICIIDAKQATL